MLLFDHDREIALWVGKRAAVDDFGSCRAIGIVARETIIAGVVYSNYRSGNIEATIAADSPRWARRGTLRALFHYPFVQLGCRRVTCIIAEHNGRSLRLCQGLGFTIEGRHRSLFADGSAGISLGMLREECRWL